MENPSHAGGSDEPRYDISGHRLRAVSRGCKTHHDERSRGPLHSRVRSDDVRGDNDSHGRRSAVPLAESSPVGSHTLGAAADGRVVQHRRSRTHLPHQGFSLRLDPRNSRLHLGRHNVRRVFLGRARYFRNESTPENTSGDLETWSQFPRHRLLRARNGVAVLRLPEEVDDIPGPGHRDRLHGVHRIDNNFLAGRSGAKPARAGRRRVFVIHRGENRNCGISMCIEISR